MTALVLLPAQPEQRSKRVDHEANRMQDHQKQEHKLQPEHHLELQDGAPEQHFPLPR